MQWLARILALAFAAVLIDAVVASLHGTTLALGSVGVGAVLALVAIAVFRARPWIATAWSFLMLTGAFAAGTLNGVGPGPALTGMSPQDAAAVVFALGVLAATVGVCVAVRVTALRRWVVFDRRDAGHGAARWALSCVRFRPVCIDARYVRRRRDLASARGAGRVDLRYR